MKRRSETITTAEYTYAAVFEPDPARARDQWHALVATLRELGARVDVIHQRPDAPDMVYAMNLGLVKALAGFLKDGVATNKLLPAPYADVDVCGLELDCQATSASKQDASLSRSCSGGPSNNGAIQPCSSSPCCPKRCSPPPASRAASMSGSSVRVCLSSCE